MRLSANLCFFASTLLGLMLAQTGGREVPPFEGDGNSSHDGQPKWCQAVDGAGYKKNCGICDRRCDDPHGDSRCKTYCRKSECRCHPECHRG